MKTNWLRLPLIAAGCIVFGLLVDTVSASADARSRAQREAMPLTITLRDAQAPAWVDASIAIDAAGNLNKKLLPFNGEQLAAFLRGPQTEGCVPFGPAFTDRVSPPPLGIVPYEITHRTSVILGRITDKAYGFWIGTPAQLLQITPERTFGAPLNRSYYYFVIPIVQFKFAGVEICKTDSRYASPGEVGTEVVLFVVGPEDRHRLFFYLDPEDIVGVNPDGSLRLPYRTLHALGSKGATSIPLTKSDLLRQVRESKAEVKQQ